MKFSLSTVGVLGLLASNVRGIELDPESPDSIKSAAKIIAKDMRVWYTGDRPGDVPGNLPDPYYWWEAGAMFNAFIDYWYYTGDTTYNAITKQAIIHQIGNFGAFEPDNQTSTLGNDDQGFWGMAAMTAAEAKFPDPDPDSNDKEEKVAPSWLALAQAVFNRQAERWDMTSCGGGLKWQIFSFNKGYNYKNTISNGCFFNIGARLAKYTGNQTYAKAAEKTWDWEQTIGLMSPDYHFFDGSDERINCSKINHYQWSYNAGVHMSGAAAMWNITGDDKWRTRLAGIINATDVFFYKDPKDIMFEVACEENGKCNVDQRSFKAYLSRAMGYTMKVAPWTVSTIMPRMKTSAKAAAAQCNAGATQTQCGLRWTQNGANDGSFGVGEQMAAMEVIQNLLIDEVPGPATEAKGGISKSDPSAGTGGTDDPNDKFRDITSGDKAGAGILTTLVLVGILGGAWFLLT